MNDPLKEMEARKDEAYLERNYLVSALAHLAPKLGWKAGIRKTSIEGWSEDWHGCVWFDTPAGQLSWHYHDSQAWLFEDLPFYEGSWDGHTTPQKYARLAKAVEEKNEQRRLGKRVREVVE